MAVTSVLATPKVGRDRKVIGVHLFENRPLAKGIYLADGIIEAWENRVRWSLEG